MYRTGHSITALTLYTSDGLYSTSDFDSKGNLLPKYPHSTLDGKGVKPGDIRYKDISGDGVIDVNDKQYMDQYHTLPSAVYGIQLGFTCSQPGQFTGRSTMMTRTSRCTITTTAGHRKTRMPVIRV